MEQAIAELEATGFVLEKDWTWTHPEKHVDDCTEREIDAIVYLIHEWDFGGMR